MKKQLIALLAVVMSVALIFGACTGAPADEADAKPADDAATTPADDTADDAEDTPAEEVTTGEMSADQSLIVGTEAHEGTYIYMYSASAYDRQVCDLVYQRLVVTNDTGIARANDLLVENLDISEDGKTYTFTLVDGIMFSDGTPLTADDVVFTYEALADPSSTAYMLSEIYPLEGAEAYFKGETEEFTAVEAVDDKTVVFHFADNLRTNIGSCTMGILSRDYFPDWERGKSDEVLNAKMSEPMGSGPYNLERYEPSQYTLLKYNEDFWADAETDYQIKDITIKYTQGDTEMDEIITESVDILPQIINKEYVDRVVNDEDGVGAPDFINLQQFKRSAYGYIGFNCAEGQASDRAMRQAIAHAFDREEYVAAEYGDLARTLSVPMSQASSVFDAVEDGLNEYEYSLDTAREILEEAGYTWEGDKCHDPSGEPVVLRFYATTNNPVIISMSPVLTDNLSELGIEIDFQSIEFASLLPIVRDKNDNSWDMFFMAQSWTSDEPDTWYAAFHENGIAQTNSVRYNNPEVSSLLDEGRTVLDLTSDEAMEIYSKIAFTLNEDLPELPIYANTLTAMVNHRVENFEMGTFQDWQWALEGAYIVDVD